MLFVRGRFSSGICTEQINKLNKIEEIKDRLISANFPVWLYLTSVLPQRFKIAQVTQTCGGHRMSRSHRRRAHMPSMYTQWQF